MIKRKEILHQSLKWLTLSAAFYLASLHAVDNKIQESLYERAGGRCESKIRNKRGKQSKERCTETKKLEVAHIQHGDSKRHNRISNLKLFCTRCHYFDHKYRKRNNLSKGENTWTLYQLWHRMTPQQRAGIPEPPIPKKNNIYRR